MIDSISASQNTVSNYAETNKSAMGKDDFLELLLAQLANQDPLEPMDSSDYAAQLAQFSSLEQLTNINDSLNNSIDTNYMLTQSINNTMTAALIGKEAKIAGNEITYNGQESTFIGYELPAEASSMNIEIYNSAGVLVKTFEDVNTDKGSHKLSWDFTDNENNKVSQDTYTVKIDAKTVGGEDMSVVQYNVGIINGVRFSSSGTALVVNNVEYSISDIFEILEPGQET